MIRYNEKEKEFQLWLNNMEVGINNFLGILPNDIRKKMDYSYESLLILENYLISNFETVNSLQEFSLNNNFINDSSRYIGQLIRFHNANFNWYITTKKIYSNWASFEEKVLIKGNSENRAWVLFGYVTACLTKERRTGTFIYDIIKKISSNMDISYITEKEKLKYNKFTQPPIILRNHE